jgi:glycerate kinase
MKIVVAPDKFKGSLPATQVAAAIAAGLLRRVAQLIARERLAEAVTRA